MKWNRRGWHYLDKETGAYRRYHRHMDLIEALLIRFCIVGIIGFFVMFVIMSI